jgi:hypothetical protein
MNLGGNGACRRDGGGTLERRRSGFQPEKVAHHFREFLGADVTVGVLVQLDHGSQGATAEAGDTLDGELALRIGVFTGSDVELPAQGFFDAVGTGHVTSGTMADVDDVFPDGAMPELVVEGGNTPERGGSDLGDGADPLEGGFGQITVMLLDRLEQGDDGVGRATEAGDSFVDKLERVIRHR